MGNVGTDATATSERKEKNKLSSFWGFLVLFVLLLLTWAASLAFTYLGSGIGFSGSAVLSPVLLVFLLLMLILFPYILGRASGLFSWMMGLSYSLVLLFAVIPLATWGAYQDRYVWFVTHSLPLAYIPVVIILGLLASMAGPYVPRAREGKKRNLPLQLESPLKSSVAVLVVSLVIAGLAPVVYQQVLVDVEPAKTLKVSEYNIEFLRPEGWYWLGVKKVVNPPMRIEEWAESRINLSESTRGKYDETEGGNLDIYIYSKMPFTGTPLESYQSEGQVYEALRGVLQQAKDNPETYFHQSNPTGTKITVFHFPDYRIYGDTTVDGTPAIKLAYREYTSEKGFTLDGNDKPLPSSSSTPDVVVYKKPYLYWFQFNSDIDKEDYNQILDSFKFI